jgi:hypothetical protein
MSSASTWSTADETMASARERLLDPDGPRVGDEGDQAGVAGRDRVLQLLLQLVVVMPLTQLAGERADRATHGRAAEDGRREEDPQRDAAHDAPAQAGAGAAGVLLGVTRQG